jgi:hypothetical protein
VTGPKPENAPEHIGILRFRKFEKSISHRNAPVLMEVKDAPVPLREALITSESRSMDLSFVWETHMRI